MFSKKNFIFALFVLNLFAVRMSPASITTTFCGDHLEGNLERLAADIVEKVETLQKRLDAHTKSEAAQKELKELLSYQQVLEQRVNFVKGLGRDFDSNVVDAQARLAKQIEDLQAALSFSHPSWPIAKKAQELSGKLGSAWSPAKLVELAQHLASKHRKEADSAAAYETKLTETLGAIASYHQHLGDEGSLKLATYILKNNLSNFHIATLARPLSRLGYEAAARKLLAEEIKRHFDSGRAAVPVIIVDTFLKRKDADEAALSELIGRVSATIRYFYDRSFNARAPVAKFAAKAWLNGIPSERVLDDALLSALKSTFSSYTKRVFPLYSAMVLKGWNKEQITHVSELERGVRGALYNSYDVSLPVVTAMVKADAKLDAVPRVALWYGSLSGRAGSYLTAKFAAQFVGFERDPTEEDKALALTAYEAFNRVANYKSLMSPVAYAVKKGLSREALQRISVTQQHFNRLSIKNGQALGVAIAFYDKFSADPDYDKKLARVFHLMSELRGAYDYADRAASYNLLVGEFE
jgi:hypothetical protein